MVQSTSRFDNRRHNEDVVSVLCSIFPVHECILSRFANSYVNPIVDDVRTRGDAAVKECIWKFEKAKLDKAVAIVSELPDPVLDGALKEAFDVAYSSIYAFHAAQKTPERIIENMKAIAVMAWGRVNLHIFLGCETIVLATPPSQDGTICKVLYCAKKAGVTRILKDGGAQVRSMKLEELAIAAIGLGD
ncbi:hypothetical protein PIB30_020784 [Stylosanthes scabra]|uniref:Uncharacterized protein n=1 Tax=Stylosanthes scabra TaxID=79078 RepID=A0ABU6R8Y1_9FABA|nr:hypothetical protein [Stylosanthes scabra]